MGKSIEVFHCRLHVTKKDFISQDSIETSHAQKKNILMLLRETYINQSKCKMDCSNYFSFLAFGLLFLNPGNFYQYIILGSSLRLPHRNDAEIAKICNLWPFWLVIQLIKTAY